MRKRINIIFLLVCMVSFAYGQKLTGRILSAADSLPISGARVMIKENLKSLTNDNGNFSITLTSGEHQITIKALGFSDLVIFQISQEASERVYYLQPIVNELKTVEINTGYQTLPKERATGSFTTIDNQTYQQQVGVNAIERLRYISNGVVPVSERIVGLGKDPMLIRGMSTLTLAVQRPLIILDNFEYQGDLDNINPNDIENVTFLKDAAAGSIWGAKAANGVIVLTTKKGKFSQPLKISANNNVTWGSKPNLSYLKEISANELIDLERFLFEKQYKFADTAKATHPVFSEVYELLFSHRAGKISAQELETQLQMYRQRDVRNDFDRFFYRNALNQQYSIGLTTGSEKFSTSLSLGHDRNSSTLDVNYRRSTIRLANQLKLGKMLNLTIETSYTDSQLQSGRPGYGTISLTGISLPIYSSFADEHGRARPLYTQYRQGYIDQLGDGKLLDWKFYPLTDYLHNRATTQTFDLNQVLGMQLKPMKDLSLDVKYRYQKQWQQIENYYDEESYFTRALINQFTQINNVGAVSYKVPKGAIRDLQSIQTAAQNLRSQLNFNRDFRSHNLNLLLGTEWSQLKNTGDKDRSYGYNPEVMSYTNVDLVNTYPQLISGSQSFIPSIKDFSGTNNRFVSFYANGAFTLMDKYTLSASVRRDASNLFGVATNERWNPFWSVGMGWNLKREKVFDRPWLDELKLRATFGYQGNIDPRKVAVTTLNYAGNNPFTQTRYNDVANYPNPNLRWERVGMLNIGTDFRLWSGKLRGSLEYYRKTMNDLYANVEIDRTTGISSGFLTRNIGQATGRGLDLELKTTQRLGQLRFDVDGIFNTYSDEITKLNEVPELGRQTISGGFVAVAGYGANAIFAYKWMGLDPANGDPVGYLDGKATKDYSAIINQTKLQDAIYIGNHFPRVFGSFGTTVAWKDISLAMRFTYKFDYYFKRESIDYTNLVSKLLGHSDYSRRWQKPGDELTTDVPSFAYPVATQRNAFYTASEIMFVKGDHFRFQYINLSYRLSSKKIKHLPIPEASLFCAVNNLGIIWRKNNFGLDPDVSQLPSPLQISFGINMKFN